MLAHQEARFVEELAARLTPGAKARFDRDDVSVLMAALRCGTDLEVLLSVAPKVNITRLHAAYQRLDRLRRESAAAWQEIADRPSERTIAEHAAAAKVLLPVPVGRITGRLHQSSRDDLVRVVAETAAEIRKIEVIAHSIETELADCEPGDPAGVESGTRLYDPHHPGIYASPFYCPDRVGSLTPLRLRDLLNERS
jgi:hypothetical protein